MNENDKQAEPVAMKYYDEHGKDKFANLFKQAEPVAWERKWSADGEKPVKKKNENGRLAWPKKFKFLAVTKHKIFEDDVPLYPHPAQPVQPVEPVAKVGDLCREKYNELVHNNDYTRLNSGKCKPTDLLYTHPPAAINEQMLRALETVKCAIELGPDSKSLLMQAWDEASAHIQAGKERSDFPRVVFESVVDELIEDIDAAIAAAKAEKAKGGVCVMEILKFIDPDEPLLDVDYDAWKQVLETRGGCSCHISPPCNNCCNPIGEDELNEVGYTYDAEKAKKGV